MNTKTATELQADWETLLLELEDFEGEHRGPPSTNANQIKEALKDLQAGSSKLLNESVVHLWPGVGGKSDLMISTRLLAAFLCCKIEEGRRSRSLPDDTLLGGAEADAGIEETVLFCKRLAIVVLFAWNAREAGYETLRALLWLVCEYAHEGLELDRRIDLERHLGLAAMEQPALYGLKRFYRDHLNHVIQVCLLGWLLFDTRLKSGAAVSTFLDLVGDRMGGVERKSLLRQWFCAALLHDVGYVIEIGKGWSKLLEHFDNRSFTGLRTGIAAAIESLRPTAIAQTDWGFTADDKPEGDHGVVSAIHANDLFKSFDKDKSLGDMKAALLAMAHHNHPKPPIKFDCEPLTAWLVLCDEVQEWDRPWTNLDNAALALSAAVIFPGGESPPWHEDSFAVFVNIEAEWDKRRGCCKACLPQPRRTSSSRSVTVPRFTVKTACLAVGLAVRRICSASTSTPPVLTCATTWSADFSRLQICRTFVRGNRAWIVCGD